MPLPHSFLELQKSALEKISNSSRRQKIVLAGLVASTASLMLTNPKQDAYIGHYSQIVGRNLVENCGKIHNRIDIKAFLFRIPVTDACSAAASGSLKLVAPWMKSEYDDKTHRTNCALFSIYSTDDIIGGKTTKTLGIAGQFVTFSRD